MAFAMIRCQPPSLMLGAVLLALAASGNAELPTSTPKVPLEARAKLNEDGYAAVAALRNNTAMQAFVRRFVSSVGKRVADESGFSGWVPYFSGVVATQSFAKLEDELRQAKWIVVADHAKQANATKDELRQAKWIVAVNQTKQANSTKVAASPARPAKSSAAAAQPSASANASTSSLASKRRLAHKRQSANATASSAAARKVAASLPRPANSSAAAAQPPASANASTRPLASKRRLRLAHKRQGANATASPAAARKVNLPASPSVLPAKPKVSLPAAPFAGPAKPKVSLPAAPYVAPAKPKVSLPAAPSVGPAKPSEPASRASASTALLNKPASSKPALAQTSRSASVNASSAAADHKAWPTVAGEAAATGAMLKDVTSKADAMEDRVMALHTQARQNLEKKKKEFEAILQLQKAGIAKVEAENQEIVSEIDGLGLEASALKIEAEGLMQASDTIRDALIHMLSKVTLAGDFLEASVNDTTDVEAERLESLLAPPKHDLQFYIDEARKGLRSVSLLQTTRVVQINSTHSEALLGSLAATLERVKQATNDGTAQLKASYVAASKMLVGEKAKATQRQAELVQERAEAESHMQSMKKAVGYLQGQHTELEQRLAGVQAFGMKMQHGVDAVVLQAERLTEEGA